MPDAVSSEWSGGEGVVVNDTPKTFVENPTDQSHAIVVKDLMDSENTLHRRVPRMGPPHFGLVAVRGFHDQLEGTYTRF